MSRMKELYGDLWKRARRIWVTGLGGCPRKLQYRLLDYEPLPDHYYQVKGRVSHKAAEQILKGEELDLDYSSLPQAKEDIEIEVNDALRNLREWMETTEIDLSGAESEVKVEVPLKDSYVLVGKIDVLTPEFILDFKSGNKRNSKSNRTQLVAYEEMVKRKKWGERKLRNIFLGGSSPVEFDPFESSRCSHDGARENLENLVSQRIKNTKRILQGKTVPTKLSFSCVFCRWRGTCRGY